MYFPFSFIRSTPREWWIASLIVSLKLSEYISFEAVITSSFFIEKVYWSKSVKMPSVSSSIICLCSASVCSALRLALDVSTKSLTKVLTTMWESTAIRFLSTRGAFSISDSFALSVSFSRRPKDSRIVSHILFTGRAPSRIASSRSWCHWAISSDQRTM